MVLQELPPELIEKILSYLTAIDILRVSLCCQKLRNIANNDTVWIECAFREYSINLSIKSGDMSTSNLRSSSICTSPKLFTLKILVPFGSNFQELWQLTNFQYYGGLAKLLYHDWCVYLVLLDPPPHPNTQKSLQPEIFCRIFLNTEYQKVSETFVANIKQSTRHDEVPLSMIKTKLSDPILNSACGPFAQLKYDDGNFLASFQERFGLRFLDLAAERMHHRIDFLNEKQQTFAPLKTNNFIPPFCPISPGIFKGTYSAHGIELVNITYEEDLKTLTGRKVTGDPNVPFDKISFQAHLDKPMFLGDEDQTSFENIVQYMTVNENESETEASSHKELISKFKAQPFKAPYNCRIDSSIDQKLIKTELWRFQARCQIAMTGYVEPRFIRGNVIIFSENIFGVIFIDLQSLGIFERVTENLNCTHFEDVLQNSPDDVINRY